MSLENRLITRPVTKLKCTYHIISVHSYQLDLCQRNTPALVGLLQTFYYGVSWMPGAQQASINSLLGKKILYIALVTIAPYMAIL